MSTDQRGSRLPLGRMPTSIILVVVACSGTKNAELIYSLTNVGRITIVPYSLDI